MSALQPWREQLQADPARVVAGVLEGWLDRGPWQRTEAMDFLLDLAGDDSELAESTAAATLSWARDKLAWDDRRRLSYGEIAHASRVADAFAVLQRLDAPKTAFQLAEQHAWFEARTKSLRFDERLDLHRLLWLATAFRQCDDRFLPRWLDFCGRAARLSQDWREWLRLGLMGLRKLGQGELSADQQALAGLLIFHQRAKPPLALDAAKFERRQFEVLKVLFPRGPTYWPEKLAEVRERWPKWRDMPEWLKAPGGSSNNAPRQNSVGTLPTGQERKAMEQRIHREPPTRVLWEAIEGLFHRCQDHAFRTGESEYLVKTVSDLGKKFLERQPAADLLRELRGWIRIGLDWDAGNAYLWTRLAECLSALNQDQEALDISWEALRRFPDDEICRTSLAELLREQGRPADAESLLRETMARFPDDVVCRASLAELLREQGRPADAESLLRETMARFPNDVVCRASLAELLRDQGRPADAESLLRQAMGDFPDNVVCRTSLAELLLASERFEEAEPLLEDTMQRFPGDAHSRSILAKSWVQRGSKDKAESLLRESARLFPQDEVFRTLLSGLSAGRYDQDFSWEKSAKQRKKAAADAPPVEPLSDPLYPWAAERALIVRLAFGYSRDDEVCRQLQEAAATGGATELAETALRLLFADDAAPLEDALRARPGSLALRLLSADKDAEQALRIAEDAPETRPVIEALYQTAVDSTAWSYRFRAAVLACADLTAPPIYGGLAA